MSNQNVLRGLMCPKCESRGPFAIECQTVGIFTDDGMEDHYDTEWNDDSHIRCCSCDHDSIVARFTE